MIPPRRVVAIHQPETLPWLGFLDKLRQCDVFVLLDDVQFEKHYFQNRNRIRTPTPQGWSWLTIPVRIGGRFGQRIDQVEIDDAAPWRRKHLAAIEQHYHRAEAFARHWPALQACYAAEPATLAEFNITIIQWMMETVGLVRPLIRSSTLGAGDGRSARLLEICRLVGATEYLSGVSGREYLDLTLFERAGIGVRFQEFRHPVYRQCYEPFVPGMSGLDLLLNCGDVSAEVLAGGLAQPASAP